MIGWFLSRHDGKPFSILTLNACHSLTHWVTVEKEDPAGAAVLLDTHVKWMNPIQVVLLALERSTVKPALSDHRFKRPPAFSNRFFHARRVCHSKLPVLGDHLRNATSDPDFLHQRPDFPCLKRPKARKIVALTPHSLLKLPPQRRFAREPRHEATACTRSMWLIVE